MTSLWPDKARNLLPARAWVCGLVTLTALILSTNTAADTANPPPVDGLWSAYIDGLGSQMTLTLSSHGPSVSGRGSYSVGALRTGTVTAKGSYHPPLLALDIRFDHGAVVTLSAKLVSGERMTGSMTDAKGTISEIEFVRP